jgi:4'-phosphopantetheinyl transferase
MDSRSRSAVQLRWEPAQAIAPLTRDEIHLWIVSCVSEVAGCGDRLDLLAPDEKRRAERFRVETVRSQFVVGRVVLRSLLEHYCGIAASEIALVYGPHGKPRTAPWQNPQALHFNLPHSGDLVLLGFSLTCELGVDIEYVRPLADAEKLAEQFLPRLAGRACGPQEFYREWTAREAECKATGEGIPELERRSCFEGSLVTLEPAADYVGAVAARGKDLRLRKAAWGQRLLSTAFCQTRHSESNRCRETGVNA